MRPAPFRSVLVWKRKERSHKISRILFQGVQTRESKPWPWGRTLRPHPQGMRERKFERKPFDVAYMQCEHSHLHTQVPFSLHGVARMRPEAVPYFVNFAENRMILKSNSRVMGSCPWGPWWSCQCSRSSALNWDLPFASWSLRRGSRILVRGAQPSYNPKGGPWAQYLLKIGVFPLTLPENCMILKKCCWQGGPGPLDPLLGSLCHWTV